ncbi:hypothetical protein X773_18515 [Mesorhizobium sp. LSJC285A00]|nr:hypothetical protein X773_18515 [Mesorhizobium sp. LSJC285A00]
MNRVRLQFGLVVCLGKGDGVALSLPCRLAYLAVLVAAGSWVIPVKLVAVSISVATKETGGSSRG